MAKKAENQKPVAADDENRVIKRYSNRKLYDTKDSRYVTLQQIGEMVRRGEHVQIIDNKTKEDKTEVTLALIISEDLKNKPSSVPLGALRSLIQERSEKLLSQLRDGPIGRLIPGAADEELAAAGGASAAESDPGAESGDPRAVAEALGAEGGAADGERPMNPTMARLYELVESSRQTFDQLEATLEERVRELVPSPSVISGLRAAVEDLTRRVEELERRAGVSPPKGAKKRGEASGKD